MASRLSSPRSCASPPGSASARAAIIPIAGAIIPGKYSPLRGFTHFTYMEEPFIDHEKMRALLSRGSSAFSAASVQSPRPPFKTTALPPAPRNAGTFQQFRYALDPFERKEEHESERERRGRKLCSGAFQAGGSTRNTDKQSLRIRLPELKTQLHRTFCGDWMCYRGIRVDGRGMLVAAFALENSGHDKHSVHAYMNRVLAHHPVLREFGVTRDSTRWGVVADNRALYAFRPPWIPNDAHVVARKAHRSPATSG